MNSFLESNNLSEFDRDEIINVIEGVDGGHILEFSHLLADLWVGVEQKILAVVVDVLGEDVLFIFRNHDGITDV